MGNCFDFFKSAQVEAVSHVQFDDLSEDDQKRRIEYENGRNAMVLAAFMKDMLDTVTTDIPTRVHSGLIKPTLIIDSQSEQKVLNYLNLIVTNRMEIETIEDQLKILRPQQKLQQKLADQWFEVNSLSLQKCIDDPTIMDEVISEILIELNGLTGKIKSHEKRKRASLMQLTLLHANIGSVEWIHSSASSMQQKSLNMQTHMEELDDALDRQIDSNPDWIDGKSLFQFLAGPDASEQEMPMRTSVKIKARPTVTNDEISELSQEEEEIDYDKPLLDKVL
jgi:hypothetical protein